jgi:hypothetical protein
VRNGHLDAALTIEPKIFELLNTKAFGGAGRYFDREEKVAGSSVERDNVSKP